jgi:branched-chain amino acid transport system substrate-binding protein
MLCVVTHVGAVVYRARQRYRAPMRRTAVLAVLVLLACGHKHPPVGSTLSLGLITGTTGPTAAWGEAIVRGAQLAVDEHNLTGEDRVQLVVVDDQGKPEQSALAAERLIQSDRVAAIVGCDTSSGSLAVSPICERERVALISPTASAAQLTHGKHFTFRVCVTDDAEAAAAAQVALERLHAKRVAILRDTRNDYSVGMAEAFASVLTRGGGTVVSTLDYAQGDADFRAQLTAAKAASPDMLFVPGYYGDVAQIASQSRDLGITVSLLGGSGWDSPKLIEIGGAALEGCWFVSGMRSASRHFVDMFRKRYDTEPDAASAQAYDAAKIACDAIELAANDRVAIRSAIAATHDFHGASGLITIDRDHNARKPLGVFRIAGGIMTEAGSVAPQ